VSGSPPPIDYGTAPSGRRCFFMHPADDHERARPPVILLVEDEALLRWATSEFLRDSGCVVIEAATACEAVAELDADLSVDVVFSDISLPGEMNGLALASCLHRRRPCLPVVLTSGDGDPVRRLATEMVGSERFLPKPYRLEELADRLRALAGES